MSRTVPASGVLAGQHQPGQAHRDRQLVDVRDVDLVLVDQAAVDDAGEPIVVADPLITAQQVDRLLSSRSSQVTQLVDRGWLQRHESSSSLRH